MLTNGEHCCSIEPYSALKHMHTPYYRIRRFVQSGLTTKWIEMAMMSFKEHQLAESLSEIEASKECQWYDFWLISILLGS
jgi:hypothetical protein